MKYFVAMKTKMKQLLTLCAVLLGVFALNPRALGQG